MYGRRIGSRFVEQPVTSGANSQGLIVVRARSGHAYRMCTRLTPMNCSLGMRIARSPACVLQVHPFVPCLPAIYMCSLYPNRRPFLLLLLSAGRCFYRHTWASPCRGHGREGSLERERRRAQMQKSIPRRPARIPASPHAALPQVRPVPTERSVRAKRGFIQVFQTLPS